MFQVVSLLCGAPCLVLVGLAPTALAMVALTAACGVLSAKALGAGNSTGRAFLICTDDAEQADNPGRRRWQSVAEARDGKEVPARLPAGARVACLTLNEGEEAQPPELGGPAVFCVPAAHFFKRHPSLAWASPIPGLAEADEFLV